MQADMDRPHSIDKADASTADAGTITHRRAVPQDAAACVLLRGLTRENAVSPQRLASYGITGETWADDIRSSRLAGHVGFHGQTLLGYGFGDREKGEVVVLALLPEAEGRGLGRELLAKVVQDLEDAGHRRLFLGCSADPSVRSHGFYRHLGWCSTGSLDAHGDEVLELHLPDVRSDVMP